MKLYYTQRSPYARKARIIAEEKNIKLELFEEDLANKSSVLLKANPVGKVPALVIDETMSLCDNPLICEYLDALTPAPRFIPQDSIERWKVLNMAAIADGLMDITVGVVMEKMRHPQDYNAKFIDLNIVSIDRVLEYFDSHLADLESWHLGSVAVVCALGYLQFRLPDLYRAEKHSKLNEWYQKISQRPSVKNSVPVA
ncbi:MAG: glutathione S-transferase N-terminal domain-containing protein [Candidatus Omnitrophica bacterium]|nr:glutathione S-transferase N-terminal domain-containing protein [Candidatus Omnitrophota bacterium]